MAEIFRTTRFTTCIPAAVGGSGNPSPATARGVRMGMEGIARHWGRELGSLSVAIQGLGEVGFRLAQELHQAGCALTVFDLEPEKVAAVLAMDPRHRASSADAILSEPVDLLSPCALGAVLNPSSIPGLRCRAICGAANNQLELTSRDSQALQQRGILYVPDFVVNRMGIVNCADEQYGRLDLDPKNERHLGWDWPHAIAPLVVRLLDESQRDGVSPVLWAEAEARRLSEALHPLWPGRAQAIAEFAWRQIQAGAFSP
jgi:glutamate dehydrogenase/leucine dehydrogenase